MPKEFDKFEGKLGFSFQNKDLFKEALTHRSYLNENPSWPFKNNERLEFLGDAVLELVATEELFNNFPNKNEGELTVYRAALVNTKMLGRVAKDIGLDIEILVSKGESYEIAGGGGEAILADTVEAVIGAAYLDNGYDVAKKFIRRFIMTSLNEVVRNGGKDAKSLIQEISQENHGLTPTYKVLEESGPAHERIFKVGLYFGGELKSEGSGNSKQNAELQAAEKLLSEIKSGNLL
ncbi:MAG: ribonuclease III [Candidatus Colwellbacteria bacterium]|nr:ribonuclease III [Candidatus Colwellbacteria bacterium]MBI3273646.1 ribonuclease III [Candidatus Colwellbacteria bacterium]